MKLIQQTFTCFKFCFLLLCLPNPARSGQLWPLPLNQSTSDRVLFLDIDRFHFKSIGFDSDILQRAFDRYESIIFDTPAYLPKSHSMKEKAEQAGKGIHRLKVYVATNDQSLNLQTDESYALTVSAPTSTLEANSVYGALHGLETFSQLIDRVDNFCLRNKGTEAEVVGEVELPHLGPEYAKGPEAMPGLASGQSRRLLSQQAATAAGSPGQNMGVASTRELIQPGHAQLRPELHQFVLDSQRLADELYSSPIQDSSIDWDSEEQGDFLDVPKRSSDAWDLSSDEDAVQDGNVSDDDDDDISDDDSDASLGRHHKHHHHKKKKHHKRHRDHDRMLIINATAIFDQPRFPHRGLLIDSARHFLPLSVIKDTLEAMAAAKMNVLHWHIVDDQSFPYQSNALPRLAQYGAFSRAHTYRSADVQEVVQFARDRGIRVIPEFDTPGHTASWGKGYPSLLTDCYNGEEQPTGEKGPVNPVRNETYALLWAFLREAAGLFPDTYLHLGGDEVPFDCWQSSPEIKAWMRENNVTSISGLETYFEERVLALARAAGRSYIVWQELLDNGVKLDSNTVVHVWKWWWPVDASHEAAAESAAAESADVHAPGACQLSRGCMPAGIQLLQGPPGWTNEMARVTGKGYRALLSSPWYLNLGPYAGEAWIDYYTVEPLGFEATPAQASLVIGGEACMWGEWVDGSNLMERTWPRAAAVAERLWSARDVRDVDAARPRIAEHRCRMLARGLAASPGTGPGYCPQDTSL